MAKMCHHHHLLPLHHHSQLHSPRNSILLGLLFPLTRPLATSACPCHVYTMRCPSISSIHPSIHSLNPEHFLPIHPHLFIPPSPTPKKEGCPRISTLPSNHPVSKTPRNSPKPHHNPTSTHPRSDHSSIPLLVVISHPLVYTNLLTS